MKLYITLKGVLMWMQRLMWIVWPAFLVAGIMEMLVFAVFDPLDMLWLGQSVELSRTAIYTLSFFVFWVIFMLAGYLTVLLSMSGTEVNGHPSTPKSNSRNWRSQESVEACYPNNA